MWMIIAMVALIAMYWWMGRSQKKEQAKRQNLLDSMKPGDSAVTIGGLHGIISEVNGEERTVTLDCEGVYLVFDRIAIRSIKSSDEETGAQVDAKDDKEENAEKE